MNGKSCISETKINHSQVEMSIFSGVCYDFASVQTSVKDFLA